MTLFNRANQGCRRDRGNGFVDPAEGQKLLDLIAKIDTIFGEAKTTEQARRRPRHPSRLTPDPARITTDNPTKQGIPASRSRSINAPRPISMGRPKWPNPRHLTLALSGGRAQARKHLLGVGLEELLTRRFRLGAADLSHVHLVEPGVGERLEDLEVPVEVGPTRNRVAGHLFGHQRTGLLEVARARQHLRQLTREAGGRP
jgi:hypothetical protein